MGTGIQPSLGAVRRVSPSGTFFLCPSRGAGSAKWCAAISRSRGADQLAGDHVLRALCRLALEAGARAPQPKGPRDLDTDGANRRAVAAARQGSTSASAASLHRQTPEVGAECVGSARSDLSEGRGVTRVPIRMALLHHHLGDDPGTPPRSPRESPAAVDHGQQDLLHAAVAQPMMKTLAVGAVIRPARLTNRPNPWDARSWHARMELHHKLVGLS